MDLPLPGGRDVRATLSDPADPPSPDEAGDATPGAVAACPPHPQMGGTRSDGRLQAVDEALDERGIACLRFDYGPWDGGRGERTDAVTAVGWLRERYDRVGLFGYSFGGAVAVLAAAQLARESRERAEGGGSGTARPRSVDAVSALAPASALGDDPDLDAAAAVSDLDGPVQVVYGVRDETADWKPIVERARELGHDPVEVQGDHHFYGQYEKVARIVVEFLAGSLAE
ncbi:alpha/beta hydrolase [Halobacteriales archaeon QS_8_69_26]|nr:MAG: alpha/beta hydrolase [Halobacteriales archaeon QS_8_69_26]